ncbi:hypothetical protein J4462_02845 [Candidatus Pacearchaeota archaeon]|nr:hypothetical protein [Candidatus Pacearchaeota archaeon]
MPYRCVHCNKMFEDGSEEILKGCSECGRKFFFFIRKEQFDKMRQQAAEVEVELKNDEKEQIERDVREIAGLIDEEIPVFLDFESVKIIRPGKYAIDLANLFSMEKPRVYRLEDGKYVIDLSSIVKKRV